MIEGSSVRTTMVLLLMSAVMPAAASDTFVSVTADAPCTIFIDDVVVSRLDPMVTQLFAVESGYLDVTARSLEVPEVEWYESVRVSSGDTEDVEIELADEVNDLIDDQPTEYQRESRLQNQDDGTVLDPETGLTWTLLDNNFDIDWASSDRYCASLMLNREEDEDPWRLPTLDELKELVDEDFWDGYKVLGQIRLSGCCVWSSEDHGSVSAWYLDYENGERGFVTRDYSEGGRVLCVR